MCVVEKDSGRILACKNENTQLANASTTKIVTAITVIQNCDNLDEQIQVVDSAIGVEGSSIYLRHGEIMSIKDLLYGLMLRSGNDSAVALACHVGGSVEGFASLMNEIAKKAGANNSNFVTPHGLDHKDHYTTAYDLAKITAYALNNPIFKEIVSTKMHIVEATNKSDKRYMNNKNKLLPLLQTLLFFFHAMELSTKERLIFFFTFFILSASNFFTLLMGVLGLKLVIQRKLADV